MATDSVMGLFATPEQLQQQQYQQAFDRNLQLARLNPRERNVAMLGTSVDRLGTAIGGALGGQDPQLQVATTIQQLAGQFDTSTSKGMADFANALREKGLYGPAAQLAAQVAPLRLKEAEATAKLREQIKVEKVGLAQSTQEPVYVDKVSNQQFVIRNGQRLPYQGGVDQTTAKTAVNVPLDRVFDKFFTQKTAEEQAKNWDLYGQAFSTIPQTREKLAEVRGLIDQSFSGAGGNVKLGAAKLARSLNLPIDVNKASNTEIVEALTTQFAISELKKNFGSNPAVKDFEAQLKVKPGILQEPETFKKLVDKLDQGLQAEELSYRQGEQYRKNNKGSIEGFNPYTARADANSKLIRLSNLVKKHQEGKITPAEQAEATKLQGELNAAK